MKTKQKLSQDEAYALGTQEQFKTEHIKLGPWTSHSLIKDPKHMCFSLSRYKFVSKMFENMDLVMEVGCGDCFGLPITAQTSKHLLAIDRDPRNVNDGKNRLGNFLKNVEFRNIDICKNIPPEKFNGIYSIDVIEHIEKKMDDLYMTNICKCLQDDGVCIIGTPNIKGETHSDFYSGVQHINLKSHADLRALMQKFFKNVFIFAMNDEIIHTGFLEMAHYLFAMGVGKKYE